MKTFAEFSAALAALLAAGAAQANPGLHLHPHLVQNAAHPMFELHPALALLAVVTCWALILRALDSFGAIRACRPGA
jgi:hypothetical protein